MPLDESRCAFATDATSCVASLIASVFFPRNTSSATAPCLAQTSNGKYKRLCFACAGVPRNRFTMPSALPKCDAAWSTFVSRIPPRSSCRYKTLALVDSAYASRNATEPGVVFSNPISASRTRASAIRLSHVLVRAPPPAFCVASTALSAIATGWSGREVSSASCAASTASRHHFRRISASCGSFVAPSADAVSALNARRASAAGLCSRGRNSAHR
mmetsp:Transcript_849/g.3534  ORF Transcript_849/g.3534 Transcript_849/m.3534 type:complete len:216 (-) Transcript_849:275-922(-)